MVEVTSDDLITASVFIIATASFTGIYYSSFYIKPENQTFFRFTKMVSGSSLLSLGVMHLLVDAVADYVPPSVEGEAGRRLDITSDGIDAYPVIFVIFLAGIVLPILMQLIAEAVGDYYVEKATQNRDNDGVQAIKLEDGKVVPSNGHVYVMKFLLTLGSIILHSIMIGLGLGSMGSDELVSVEAMLIALVFHQFFEGFSVGCLLTELKSNHGVDISGCFKYSCVLLFSLSTPIGIAVAKGTLQESINNTSAGFNAFAGGVIVSSALGEVIFPEIFKASPSDKYHDKLLIVGAIILGNGIMAMLAIWA